MGTREEMGVHGPHSGVSASYREEEEGTWKLNVSSQGGSCPLTRLHVD